MADIHLTMGFNDYDHVRDLSTGRVKAEGIDLTCLQMRVEETFQRFLQHREWDVSELSFAMASAAIDRGEAPFVLIPVFPSRVFRLSAIYVRADGAVAKPEDLAGKRVGMPQWTQTATVYIRGWLSDTVGVPLTEIAWFQMGAQTGGRIEAAAIHPPAGVSVTDIAGGSLAEMLIAGELDAILSAAPPRLFLEGDGRIVRLFPDFQAAEEQYFGQTGIFPIMHTVALRRSSYEANRWIARNLYKAFDEAKNRCMTSALEMTASRFPFAWCYESAEQARDLFGDDFFPYGIEPNRTTLEAFLQYTHEQGLAHRLVKVEELFPPELQGEFKI